MAAALVISAILLSLERLTYYWVGNHPRSWIAATQRQPLVYWAGGRPVESLRALFYGFKTIQVAVFVGWCIAFGSGWLPLPAGDPVGLALGLALGCIGLALNALVFSQLGETGVFYGREMGYDVPWVRRFPFSLMPHPQYVGAVLCIWSFFLIMRYPAPDWYYLPVLETVYYAVGARYEA